jgi:hypothetical protein
VSELDELEAAFARGDYRTVRARAAALLASSTDEAEKKRVRALVEKTTPHPLAKYMFLLAALLLLLLSSYWLSESKKPHDAPPPAPSATH